MRRPLFAIVVVAVLAGCGSAVDVPGEGSRVRAVDRPARHLFERWSQPTIVVTVTSGWVCPEPEGPDDASSTDDCDEMVGGKTWDRCDESTTEDPDCKRQFEEAEAMRERWLAAVSPAPDSEPRVFAEMDLEDGRSAELVGWRTAKGRVCTLVHLIPGPEHRTVQSSGDCGYEPCSSVCLGTLVLHEDRLALTGTVPDTVDAVRVTTEAGRTILHELEGPTVLDSERRAFVLELGRDTWRKVEVLDDARVVETVDLDPEGALLEPACRDEEECLEGEAEVEE